ncbi:Fic/DOC family N-terminal domain-containing protein [Desulfobacula sp.]|uniref:Fic family protein n=1 Tax=Desulfobacula sp. TaxID=2593537 RepID=UPI0025C0F82E|nr:Fic/DOC family N-terminal domain-containing protein [Desulfobacula sp.]MBC2704537.1 Fic family protein [Desulfobacula sp.]
MTKDVSSCNMPLNETLKRNNMPKPFISEKLPLENINWENLVTNIVKANSAVAKFDGLLESIPNPLLFLNPLMIQEAVLSSKIEGTQASLNEVLAFEAAPKRKQDNINDIEEVINYRNALLFATKELENRPVCLNFIKDMHKILLQGVRGQNKARGEFRRIQNWIGKSNSTIETASYVPPEPHLLLDFLSNWEKYCHYNEKDKLVQLAIIHAQFEIIHPFLDGNGRIGRILIPLFLFEQKILKYPALYVSEFFEENRQNYYDNLRAVSDKKAWHEWINYFLEAITSQAINNTKRAKSIIQLYEEMKHIIQDVTKSRNSLKVQDFLFSKLIFETPNFTESTELSKPHAARVIKNLLENKIIDTVTPAQGRRPAMYSFKPLMEIVK